MNKPPFIYRSSDFRYNFIVPVALLKITAKLSIILNLLYRIKFYIIVKSTS